MPLAQSFNWTIVFGMPNIIFAVGAVIAVVGAIAAAWAYVNRQRSLDELKATLVQRGLSADEIERIVRAQPETGKPNCK